MSDRSIKYNKEADKLLIVESPSKCSKIEHFLGIEYSCIASKGHLREINGLKSINTKSDFLPTFSIISEKKKHIHDMQHIIKKFNKKNIFLATDDDREGEAIAWHICDIFNLPLDTKRITFHEITKSAIVNAVQNPTIINMSLVMAQQARQVLDVIVGYKVSPFLWKHIYNSKENSLSAGRCQSPALKLVYENHIEKQETKIKCEYKINGVFTNKNFNAILDTTFTKESEILEFLNESKIHKHTFVDVKETNHKNSAPKPFNTSVLLQSASNDLNMSPKETMSICQILYQSGYITYMRTDSRLYSNDFSVKLTKFIENKYDKKYLGNIDQLINTDNNNPHEAIRVTQLEVSNVNNDNPRVNTLYKLLWRNTIQSGMKDYTFIQHNIRISAPRGLYYKFVLENPVFYGWKILSVKGDITSEQSKITSELFYINSLKNNTIDYNNINAYYNIISSHKYYTEASLIKKLESLEIGRPSTYSTIVETIKDRGYVVRGNSPSSIINVNEFNLIEGNIISKSIDKEIGNDKNKLIIQPIGIIVIEFLNKYFNDLFCYEYTKNMEKQLDDIANNIISKWESICRSCYNDIKLISKNMKDVSKPSYEIQENYFFQYEKYGPVVKHILDDGNIEYFPGNKEIKIDIDKLKNKGYSLDELLEPSDKNLGKYNNEDVILKNGRYGYYIQWGDNKESIKDINKPVSSITIDTITEYLDNKTNSKIDNSIVRILSENTSIRRGKYGIYCFYKSA